MAKITNTWSTDPHFSEVYAQMSDTDLAMIDAISKSVNQEVDRRVAAAPFFYRYFGVIAISTFVVLCGLTCYKIATAPDKPVVLAHHTNTLSEEDQVPTAHTDETEDLSLSAAIENEHPQNPENTKTGITPITETNGTNLVEPDLTETKLDPKVDVKPDPKTDKIPDTKTDNTRNFVDESNKIVMLRSAGATIISKTNSYDNETKSGSTKVNDPNIGSKVVTKPKSNSYSIDDMPYYQGGDAALISYLIRNLNYKISLMRKEVVNSVNVQFTVTAKGQVENIEVIGDVPSVMEKEIIKVVQAAPDWKAGKKSGKKGSIDVMLNLQFN